MTSITFDYNTEIFRTLARLVTAVPKALINAAYRYHVNAKAERELNAMDSYMLADIGVNRGDIHSRVWSR